MTETSRTLVGVNLPWLFGAYGHDLAPNERRAGWPASFDVFAAYRPLVEARELGFEAVRIWLCEAGEGIVTRDGVIDSVHPALLDAVRALQEGARLTGLRIVWTFLDAHTWAREGDALTRSILADRDVAARFAERVAAPIARALDSMVTLAVELAHEPEALTGEVAEPVSWEAITASLRVIGEAVRSARPGTLVTVGTLPEFAGRLGSGAAGLDAVEVHASGSMLPSRESLGLGALPVIGHCETLTGDALAAAEAKGYAAVFVARLEGELIDAKESGRPLTEAGTRVRAVLAAR